MNSRFPRLAAILCLAVAPIVRADGPQDNIVDKVRPVPAPSTRPVEPALKTELEKGIADLAKEIEDLRKQLQEKPDLLLLLPDVEIYYNAVRYPLKYGETFDPKAARKALADGKERARALHEGKAPWLTVSGPRGYVSRIDGSVQPYLLLVPAAYKPGEAKKHRLDFWCHGRDENLMELKFINGNVKPELGGDGFIATLYGRYCNANKFAGEVDMREVLSAVRKQYPIDDNRVTMLGFSMGGAAAWQFAVHYTDLFAVASPGAGFSETQQFLRVFQKEQVGPPWYEQKLWHMYDCNDYAVNLFNLPTIAYAGELDSQKQASDVMEKAMAEEGLKLERFIGPGTKHAYHKETKVELNKRLNEIVAVGRNPVPEKIRFTTWTLRYNRMFWTTVDGMARHWDRARVDAEIVQGKAIQAKTQNVTAITFSFKPLQAPFANGTRPMVILDDTKLDAPIVASDKPWSASFSKLDGGWKVASANDSVLRKRHDLQGPIDDAFMDSFLFVKGTGKPINEKVGAWEAAEFQHAVDHWRKQFRGEARVKWDEQLTDADIASNNLILFGDPSSNRVLTRIADKLPIKWDPMRIAIGAQTYSADRYVPVMIYPNPLNPNRYIVLNSGFTYREYDYLNNARQVPKLPDYAIIFIDSPVTSRALGKVAQAGFFDEKWSLQDDDGRGGK